MGLHFYERDNASGLSPKQLMIFLHGYGANGQDLISLAPEFFDILPDCYFISPDAPYPFEGGMYNAYQWYGLMDRSEKAMLANARLVAPLLNEFIDSQLERFSLHDKDLIIAGFSQGGMMAIHNMYRRKNACAAIISFSGFLIGPDELAKEIKSRPPILMTHGTRDRIVPFSALDNSIAHLRALNIEAYELSVAGLGHGIDDECIDAAKDFLTKLPLR